MLKTNLSNKRNNLVRWAITKVGLPFVWGKTDCTTITLEGIEQYYGIKFPFENTWVSLKEALRAYKEHGTPPELLEKEGLKKIPKNFEQTGDIFCWQGHGYWLIGIVIYNCVLVADEGKATSLKEISSFTENYIVFGRRHNGG